MPFSIIELDNSLKEDNITVLLGQNVILKIIEKPNSKALLENPHVKKFISCSNLCKESLQKQLSNLFDEESKLYSGMNSESRDFILEMMNFQVMLRSHEESQLELVKNKKDFDEKLKKEIVSLRDFTTQHIKQMKANISKINETLVSIDKGIGKELGFSVLTPQVYFVCPNCGMLILPEEYEANEKCVSCGKESKKERIEHIYLHKIKNEIREVWKTGLWFEAYVSRLLRKLDWQTWTNVYVMGSSGILHEIDFLAIKNGSVIVGECKTGKVSRTDVFNFITKAGDIKAHISIYAMISDLPEPETREIIRRNPSIIRLEGMCKLEEENIVDDLKTRLSFKI